VEFLAIMFVGTLIAIWAVSGSRPSRKTEVSYLPPVIPPEMNPRRPPETWQYDPVDEAEFTVALDRHFDDPGHNPFPSPPPPQPSIEAHD
jgi:hypothetical protein